MGNNLGLCKYFSTIYVKRHPNKQKNKNNTDENIFITKRGNEDPKRERGRQGWWEEEGEEGMEGGRGVREVGAGETVARGNKHPRKATGEAQE